MIMRNNLGATKWHCQLEFPTLSQALAAAATLARGRYRTKVGRDPGGSWYVRPV